MSVHYARYELTNGYIHNWLVAGPQAIPVSDLERYEGPDWKLQIARHYYQPDSGVTQAPVQDESFRVGLPSSGDSKSPAETGKPPQGLESPGDSKSPAETGKPPQGLEGQAAEAASQVERADFQSPGDSKSPAETGKPPQGLEGQAAEAASQVERADFQSPPLLTWRYIRCDDDHFVDCTAFYHVCHYLRTWAYSRVVSPAAQDVTCVLTTNGPADVWLNGEHVHRQEHFHHQIPASVAFGARLKEGPNDLLVRFEAVAARECPFAMALRIVEPPRDAFVFVPTSHAGVARRQTVERAIEAAYLDRDTFVYDDEITVHWPKDLVTSTDLTARLQTPDGWIYSEARAMVSAGYERPLAAPYEIPEGRYHVFLFPSLREYYEGNLRLERRMPLVALRNTYSQTPYGDFDDRRAEALADAARRDEGGNIYAEIAKMALGLWAEVEEKAILEAIAGINQRRDCSDFYLVGLLGMLHRFGQDPSFPASLRAPLEACALNFRYWADEPGADAMWFWSENHQILFHACEILAGQLYPDRIFTNNGQTGAWHRQRGEERAISWLLKRGAGGFVEWDSNCYFEEDLLALSHLADLAESQPVYDLATVVMDKMFLTMALNSYRGTFGSTHGRTYTPHIKGGRGEATAGISRLMWGMGAFNDKIMATVSLACMENYGFPRLIGDIAADLPDEMWNRERHAGTLVEGVDYPAGRLTGDWPSNEWAVNKVTYKTPDYMLCSAQDHHPGKRGVQQHIWQATLGPDAVVFVTHPPCLSEENSHRPGFWHGNVILPRVAQWKDVLIAVHRLPDDDWLGFTHAYFPAWAFDEHALREDRRGHTWAFARKGKGYLALTAARGLEFVTRGNNAYRELRSHGQSNVWVCHMGRAALDGDFRAFQERILALPVDFGEASVRCATLRGETLAFGWEGPFLRNDEVQPLAGFKHYDNPYCVADWPATQLEVRYGDQAMRLDFASEPDPRSDADERG